MSRWAFGPILTTGREGARWHLTEMGPDVLVPGSTSLTIRLRKQLHTLALVRDFLW